MNTKIVQHLLSWKRDLSSDRDAFIRRSWTMPVNTRSPNTYPKACLLGESVWIDGIAFSRHFQGLHSGGSRHWKNDTMGGFTTLEVQSPSI